MSVYSACQTSHVRGKLIITNVRYKLQYTDSGSGRGSPASQVEPSLWWSPCSLSDASFAGLDYIQGSAIFLSSYPSPKVLLQNGHHLWWHPQRPSSWMLEWGLSSTIFAPNSSEGSFLDDVAMLCCLLRFLPCGKNHLQQLGLDS